VVVNLYDVSVRLTDWTPTSPGSPRDEMTLVTRVASGDSANVSALHLGARPGAHVDGPRHLVRRGLQQQPGG
jgi:kynurenine formamidase